MQNTTRRRSRNPRPVHGVDTTTTDRGLSLTDGELVARAKRGDTTAFDALVRRHQGVAQRAAWLITGSSEEAADATQEGFVKAWNALDRFRDDLEFRPWLLRIVVNTARNRRRSAWRFDALRARAAALPAPVEQSAEDAAMAATQHDALIAAMARMGARDREVLACRYLLELSEAETAQVLGCAAGTVKSRLSRALGRLRAQIEGDPAFVASAAGGAG